MAASPSGRYASGVPKLEGAFTLSEFDGPWSFPPPPQAQTPPAARKRPRISKGMLIWLGLMAGAAAFYAALCLAFPAQGAEVDQTDVVWLLGVLAVVSSGLVYMRRFDFGRGARNAAIWLGIAATFFIGYVFFREVPAAWPRLAAAVAPAYAQVAGPHAMTVKASEDGGFYIVGQANGAPIRFAVDTGAGDIVLSPADAKRAGVDMDALKFSSPSETANGVGYSAPYTLPRLQVGPLVLANVPVEVNRAPMSASLLGMTFLKRLDAFEIHGDTLTLKWRP
ncbi:MAG: retropepsin-like aspartic protease family protein [Caulobacteraceae bacterium]